MKKLVLVLAAILAVALAAVPGAIARPDGATADPGITSRSITIGSTLPLSGGTVSLYARIGTGMRAYFSYINARRARDGKRGVYGRQIVLKIYDDQYQEAQTVQQTRRAVEQDRVFAMLGGLGTENQQAVRAYMNQRKVP
jgi:branched-chain amino acid transport system substrate-binding protein